MFGKQGLRSVLLMQIVGAVEYQPERWEAVGRVVTAAVRGSALGLDEVARRAGVSDKFVRAMMKGTPRKYGAKAATLGTFFGWDANWLDDLLVRNIEPPAVSSPGDASRLAALEAQVAALRTELRALQRDVISLGAEVVPASRRVRAAAPRSPGSQP